MYTRPTYSIKILLRHVTRPLVLIILYSGVVYYTYAHLDVEEIDIPLSISTVLGFAVSLLLGFRTSAAYDRWWEARKIWGAIVNDSRSFARQIITYAKGDKEEIQRLSKLVIAWCYALKNGLRGLDPMPEIVPYLHEEDLRALKNHQNKHNGLLLIMEQRLAFLRKNETIDTFQWMSMDELMRRFSDSMGKCERIKNTVFPVQYRVFTHTGIFIYMVMLPFGMLKSTGPFVIPITATVMFFFRFLELIAHYLQNPFRNKESDTPMSSLCRTIEINILQMLGEDDVPEALKPDDKGVLM